MAGTKRVESTSDSIAFNIFMNDSICSVNKYRCWVAFWTNHHKFINEFYVTKALATNTSEDNDSYNRSVFG